MVYIYKYVYTDTKVLERIYNSWRDKHHNSSVYRFEALYDFFIIWVCNSITSYIQQSIMPVVYITTPICYVYMY